MCDYRFVAGSHVFLSPWGRVYDDDDGKQEEEVPRDDDNKKIGKLTDILGTTPCTQLRLAC